MTATPAAPAARVAVEAGRARADLAAAHRMGVIDNLHTGTWNHMSCRVPGAPGRLLITPCDSHWALVTASSLAEIGPEDADGMRERDPGLWIAYSYHAGVYARRPDVAAMIHVHSPYATALGMIDGGRMEVASHAGLTFFENAVAYSDDNAGRAAGFGRSGEDVAGWLGDKTVLFVRNHGVVVVGPSVPVTYTDTYLVERACEYQMLAMAAAAGKPLRLSAEGPHAFESDEEARAVRERHFIHMRGLLDATQPDYAS